MGFIAKYDRNDDTYLQIKFEVHITSNIFKIIPS